MISGFGIPALPEEATTAHLGVLDVLCRSPPRPSGRQLDWAQHLAVLATRPREWREFDRTRLAGEAYHRGVAVSYELDRELGIFELRDGFLEHTRRAWALLPPFDSVPPRILDIGCGTGTPSLELARLGGGDVVGIDIDEAALAVLRERAGDVGLGDRVTTWRVSLEENGLPDAAFDVLWEEGVLHMLDVDRSLSECRRLLKPGCHLVMHETTLWLDGIRERLADHGFAVRATHPLPRHFWLTHWADPLDARLRAFERSHDLNALNETTASALATHRAAVAAIRADPDATRCAYWVVARAE